MLDQLDQAIKPQSQIYGISLVITDKFLVVKYLIALAMCELGSWTDFNCH